MPHVSIILVDFNSHKETKECLVSLSKLKATSFNYDVVVVDNASVKPLTQKWVERYHPQAHLVRSQANLGFTGGNNLGVHWAIEQFDSDYVLLLNNDTTVEAEFLNKLMAQAVKFPEQGIITPKIYFYPGREFHKKSYLKEERGKVFWYAGGEVDRRHLDAFHRGVDEVDRGHFDNQIESAFATGCAMFIKREVLEKVGYLDKRYFLYFEDVDFSLRAKKAGYKIGFCPKSVVWHKNAGSSGGSGSSLHQYYQTRNRLLFSLLHGPARAKLTTVKYALRLLFKGDRLEKLAVWHLVTGKFGKQSII